MSSVAVHHQRHCLLSQPVPPGRRETTAASASAPTVIRTGGGGKAGQYSSPVRFQRKDSQKLPSNTSMSLWPRLNHLASLTSLAETVPEKKPLKRLTVGSCQHLPPFSPVSFWRNLQRSPFGSGTTVSSLPGLSCLPTRPPQSSVPQHAGALCSPRSLLLLKGPLALASLIPGALGPLSQRRILGSMRSRDVPVHTMAVCCSLPGSGLRASGWNSSCMLPEAPPGCLANSGSCLPRGKCRSPSQTGASCPAPFLEDCCHLPSHPSSRKVLTDILLILPPEQLGYLRSISFPPPPLTQDDRETPGH